MWKEAPTKVNKKKSQSVSLLPCGLSARVCVCVQCALEGDERRCFKQWLKKKKKRKIGKKSEPIRSGSRGSGFYYFIHWSIENGANVTGGALWPLGVHSFVSFIRWTAKRGDRWLNKRPRYHSLQVLSNNNKKKNAAASARIQNVMITEKKRMRNSVHAWHKTLLVPDDGSCNNGNNGPGIRHRLC